MKNKNLECPKCPDANSSTNIETDGKETGAGLFKAA